MAHPFGGHPTLSQYLDWAKGAGCVITAGVDSQTSIPLFKIVAPNGRYAFVTGVEPNEYLMATTVGSLDRRLGLLSPWFGLPLNS